MTKTATTTRTARSAKTAEATPARKTSKVLPAKKAPRAEQPKAQTRAQLLETLAEKANVEKSIVRDVLKALAEEVELQLAPKGDGAISIPGVAKLSIRTRAATKGGEPTTNRFTGEASVTKPRPARRIVKVRVLSAVKKAADPKFADLREAQRAARKAEPTRAAKPTARSAKALAKSAPAKTPAKAPAKAAPAKVATGRRATGRS